MSNGSSTHTFKAGDILFREGDAWDGLYLIKKGNAEVYRERNGRTIRLALLVPNEFIGTVTIFSREPRVASVRAVGDLVVQHFDPDCVHQNFGTTNPAVSGFMRDIVSRLKDMNRQYTDVVVQMSDDSAPAWQESLRHVRQLAYFLIVLTRTSGFPWEGKTCVPVEGLAGVQRNLFSFREGYGEALFQLLVQSGLLTLAEIPGRGPCLVDPAIPKLQAFLEFTEKPGSLEIVSLDRPEEMLPVLRLLDGLMATLGTTFPLKQLHAFLEKVMPDAPPTDSAVSLAMTGLVSLLEDGRVRLNALEILRHLHFNAILVGVQALSPEVVPLGAA